MILYFTPINIFYSLWRINTVQLCNCDNSNLTFRRYYWITVKFHQFENNIRANLEAYPFSMHVCKHAYEESPLKNSKFVYFYPIWKITPSSTGNLQLTRILWNFLRAVNWIAEVTTMWFTFLCFEIFNWPYKMVTLSWC